MKQAKSSDLGEGLGLDPFEAIRRISQQLTAMTSVVTDSPAATPAVKQTERRQLRAIEAGQSPREGAECGPSVLSCAALAGS